MISLDDYTTRFNLCTILESLIIYIHRSYYITAYETTDKYQQK